MLGNLRLFEILILFFFINISSFYSSRFTVPEQLLRNDLSRSRLPRVYSKSLPIEIQYHGTTTLAFIYKSGIIVAVDSRASMGDFVGSRSVKKVFPVTKHIVATMAGGAADCSFWIRRVACLTKIHDFNSGTKMSTGSVARSLASMLRDQRGRELSVGTMVAGCTEEGHSSLFYVDNDGTCVEGKMFCVGSGASFAYSILDSIENLEAMNCDEALKIAERAVVEATYRDGYSGGFVNIIRIDNTGFQHIRRIDSRSKVNT